MQTQHATTEARGKFKVETAPQYIVVTGERDYKFATFHWRQAIRQYLACIWTNRFSYQETADLQFPTWAPNHGNDTFVMLRYLAVNKKFEAFGSFDQNVSPTFQHVRKESVLRVSVETPELLEIALARFAWNQQIRVLGITFPDHREGTSGMGKLWLWNNRGISVYEEPRDLWYLR